MTQASTSYPYHSIHQEPAPFSYFRMPRHLLTDSRFKDLSNDAKLLYMLLLDRLSLSYKNQWKDDGDRVFIYYTIGDACEALGKSHATVVRLMAELDDVKGCGFIARKKQGQGKPDMIFVKEIIPVASPNENATVSICAQKETPKSINLKHQEVQNLNTNKLKEKKPEKIYSLPPSSPPKDKEQILSPRKTLPLEREMDRELLQDQVLRDLHQSETIPASYLANSQKLSLAIEELSGLDEEREKMEQGGDPLEFKLCNLFCQGLTKLLTSKREVFVKGERVNQQLAFDLLLQHISMGESGLNLFQLLEGSVLDFKEGSRQNQVKNPLGYMMSCIWTVMLNQGSTLDFCQSF